MEQTFQNSILFMSMLLFNRCLILFTTILLLLIFIFLAFDSWNKFKEERISTNVRERKQHSFQYPSITVCPVNAFRKVNTLPPYLNGSYEKIRKYYRENVRTLQEVFYFVNQKTWSKDGHQCMTTRSSRDPGRPCVFPFSDFNETFYKCRIPPALVINTQKIKPNNCCPKLILFFKEKAILLNTKQFDNAQFK